VKSPADMYHKVNSQDHRYYHLPQGLLVSLRVQHSTVVNDKVTATAYWRSATLISWSSDCP